VARMAWAGVLVGGSLLVGCAGTPTSIVQGPTTALPISLPPAYVERPATGSLFQPGMTSASLFTGRRKPRNIGDTLKIDISESLNASNTVNNESNRQSALSSKGPGNAPDSLISGLLNQNISASGSNSFKGNGTSKNNSSFTAQLAASVINVLANGNLVVAGERSMSLNGGVSTLRFSGIADPKDIKDGNIILSSDVVNARLEVVGQGDVSEGSTRNWLQRVLNNTLSVW